MASVAGSASPVTALVGDAAPNEPELSAANRSEAPVLQSRTTSANQTKALGAVLADLLEDGDLLVLVGDLGAGKTAFVQGLAAALGVETAVTSPTFTLANRYEGRLTVNHLDVYRFETLSEVQDLALDELLGDGVTVVEWGERILALLGAEHLVVTLRFGAGDDDRCLDFCANGAAWARRRDQLAQALEPWTAQTRGA